MRRTLMTLALVGVAAWMVYASQSAWAFPKASVARRLHTWPGMQTEHCRRPCQRPKLGAAPLAAATGDGLKKCQGARGYY